MDKKDYPELAKYLNHERNDKNGIHFEDVTRGSNNPYGSSGYKDKDADGFTDFDDFGESDFDPFPEDLPIFEYFFLTFLMVFSIVYQC